MGKSEAPLAFLAPQTGLAFLEAPDQSRRGGGGPVELFFLHPACISSTPGSSSRAATGIFKAALGEAPETNKKSTISPLNLMT